MRVKKTIESKKLTIKPLYVNLLNSNKTIYYVQGVVCGVMVIVIGKGHGDPSSKPDKDVRIRERYESNFSPDNYRQIIRYTGLFSFRIATALGEGKFCMQT